MFPCSDKKIKIALLKYFKIDGQINFWAKQLAENKYENISFIDCTQDGQFIGIDGARDADMWLVEGNHLVRDFLEKKYPE